MKTKRNINIINDTINDLERFIQNFYQQLPKNGLDPDTNKRIKSDLDDLRICIKLYENRLERESNADTAEPLLFHGIPIRNIAVKLAVIIDTESRNVLMQGEDIKG